MKKNLLLFRVIGMLTFLSSCASLHENLSKKELEKAIHAKIDGYF